MTRPIFKGDDTGAFGNNFITIDLSNPLNYPISKVLFVINSGCGIKPKEYKNPVFPIIINFSSQESSKFQDVNTCRLIAYDQDGKQYTCPQTLTFKARNGVIIDVR